MDALVVSMTVPAARRRQCATDFLWIRGEGEERGGIFFFFLNSSNRESAAGGREVLWI